MTESRYLAYQRVRKLLPVLGSYLGHGEVELLRQTAEDLLLMRPGEERLGSDALDRAAEVLGTLSGLGRLAEAHAELLLDTLAACGASQPQPA
jgi:hypothetical protein